MMKCLPACTSVEHPHPDGGSQMAQLIVPILGPLPTLDNVNVLNMLGHSLLPGILSRLCTSVARPLGFIVLCS